MAIVNKRIGAPVTISLGRRGQKPNFYAARLVSSPTLSVDGKGRPQEFCTVIYHAQSLAGEDYLAERIHNLAFALDRNERDPMLDGTPDQPKSWVELVGEKAAAFVAYSSGLPVADQEVSVDALMAADTGDLAASELPI